ncbi:MAG: hypothetical protein ACOYO1_07325 [Bacteroidales bacterium]
MNKIDIFLIDNDLQDNDSINEITNVELQVNEIKKELNSSIENFVNSFIVEKKPVDSFVDEFIKAVNAGLLGKVQVQNAKIILSLSLCKYLIKRFGINSKSSLYQIFTSPYVIRGIAVAIAKIN